MFVRQSLGGGRSVLPVRRPISLNARPINIDLIPVGQKSLEVGPIMSRPNTTNSWGFASIHHGSTRPGWKLPSAVCTQGYCERRVWTPGQCDDGAHNEQV